MSDKSTRPSKYERAQWVWICQMISGKFARTHVEVDEIDIENRITRLANDKKLKFIEAGNFNYDTYLILGTDRKILVERPVQRYEIIPESTKIEQSSDFSWE